MSDAPNPQLVPGWTVQNQGASGHDLLLVSSEGPGDGGGPASLVAVPAANVAAASAATAPASAADTATLAKLSDVQALIVTVNAEIAALKAASLQHTS